MWLALLAWTGLTLAQESTGGGGSLNPATPDDVATALNTLASWVMGVGGAGGASTVGAGLLLRHQWLKMLERLEKAETALAALQAAPAAPASEVQALRDRIAGLEAQDNESPQVPVLPELPKELGERLATVEEQAKSLRRDHDGLKQDLQRDLDQHRESVTGQLSRIHDDVRRAIEA